MLAPNDVKEVNKKPLARKTDSIGTVFTQTVNQVQNVLKDDSQTVDLEITFGNVSIKRGGIPIFAPKSEQSTMQIKLATRIRKTSKAK